MKKDVVIKVENLSKKYVIGAQQKHFTLRDKVGDFLSNPLKSRSRNKKEDFWALKNVSFEVNRGEVVGIIGKNGSGKSTLLKILSRIAEPTKGSATLKGRVASLLEVGTGFNPELTGRENVYLNGAILGMSRKEVESKFDEIVAFSGVEKFIDTPVKRYSSGMYVRLAFAVAAHLDSDILLVDEVLAVGDVEFQKKCLGKMNSLAKSGRTVLFVSHSMTTIRNLCQKTIVLNGGKIKFFGGTDAAIYHYNDNAIKEKTSIEWSRGKYPENSVVRLLSAKIFQSSKKILKDFDVTKSIKVQIKYKILESDIKLTHSIKVVNSEGSIIFISNDVTSKTYEQHHSLGTYITTAIIPKNLLNEGVHFVSIILYTESPHEIHVYLDSLFNINIFDNINGDSARGKYTGPFPGLVRPLLNWKTQKL